MYKKNGVMNFFIIMSFFFFIFFFSCSLTLEDCRRLLLLLLMPERCGSGKSAFAEEEATAAVENLHGPAGRCCTRCDK